MRSTGTSMTYRRGRTRTLGVLVAAVLVSAGVTACSGNDGTDTTQTTGTSVSTSDDASGSGDSQNQTPIPKLEVERVRVDLDSPIAAIALPEGQGLIIAERAGRVRVLDLSGNSPHLSDPAIDISKDVSTELERGLLGLALSPDNDRIFLSYTNSAGNTRLDGYDITWRGTSVTDGKSPLVIDTSSRSQLLAVDQPYANHNGGHIEFGPDSMLYLGLGDGGAADDPEGNGQNRSTLLGKLLRLDPDRSPSDGLAPSDNPFVDAGGARPEIWSTGLRNPWRFSFDPANGDLWIADVGQNRVEEINR
ncbi:MAG: PQQ-dependent sugar dehydrogenase, partial [Microthrixaceae bacterium]|nr:PQQ-dependent sugar dehydrogenase [Microthrixaceae bacterium]